MEQNFNTANMTLEQALFVSPQIFVCDLLLVPSDRMEEIIKVYDPGFICMDVHNAPEEQLSLDDLLGYERESLNNQQRIRFLSLSEQFSFDNFALDDDALKTWAEADMFLYRELLRDAFCNNQLEAMEAVCNKPDIHPLLQLKLQTVLQQLKGMTSLEPKPALSKDKSTNSQRSVPKKTHSISRSESKKTGQPNEKMPVIANISAPAQTHSLGPHLSDIKQPKTRVHSTREIELKWELDDGFYSAHSAWHTEKFFAFSNETSTTFVYIVVDHIVGRQKSLYFTVNKEVLEQAVNKETKTFIEIQDSSRLGQDARRWELNKENTQIFTENGQLILQLYIDKDDGPGTEAYTSRIRGKINQKDLQPVLGYFPQLDAMTEDYQQPPDNRFRGLLTKKALVYKKPSEKNTATLISELGLDPDKAAQHTKDLQTMASIRKAIDPDNRLYWHEISDLSQLLDFVDNLSPVLDKPLWASPDETRSIIHYHYLLNQVKYNADTQHFWLKNVFDAGQLDKKAKEPVEQKPEGENRFFKKMFKKEPEALQFENTSWTEQTSSLKTPQQKARFWVLADQIVNKQNNLPIDQDLNISDFDENKYGYYIPNRWQRLFYQLKESLNEEGVMTIGLQSWVPTKDEYTLGDGYILGSARKKSFEHPFVDCAEIQDPRLLLPEALEEIREKFDSYAKSINAVNLAYSLPEMLAFLFRFQNDGSRKDAPTTLQQKKQAFQDLQMRG